MSNIQTPTDAELAILQVLWAKHPETVRYINDTLNAQRGPNDKEIGYTTTLKMMQLMLEKGMLSRTIVERNHLYEPAVSSEITRNQIIQDMAVRAFGGSALSLAMQALGNAQTSPEDIAKVRAWIDSLENGQL